MKFERVLCLFLLVFMIFKSAYAFAAAGYPERAGEEETACSENLEIAEQTQKLFSENDEKSSKKGYPEKLYRQALFQIRQLASGNEQDAVISLTCPDDFTDWSWSKQQLGLDDFESFLCELKDPDGNIIYDIDGKTPIMVPSEKTAAAVKNFITPHINLLVYRLMADCPYEFYWFDRQSGIVLDFKCVCDENTLDVCEITVYFHVAEEYLSSSAQHPFALGARTPKIKRAFDNARKIVKKHSNEDDMQKLISYKEEICKLASPLKEGLEQDAFGIANVLDKDNSSHSLPSGYAKSFQYLCSLSKFEDESISCSTVEGFLNNEAHQWNIIRKNDQSFLCDIYFSDEQTPNFSDSLFMKNCGSDGFEEIEKSVSYKAVSGFLYTYDENTLAAYENSDILDLGSKRKQVPKINTEEITISYEDELTDSMLSNFSAQCNEIAVKGTFSWENKEYENAGKVMLSAKFTPEDSLSFEEVKNIKVPVIIRPKEIEISLKKPEPVVYTKRQLKPTLIFTGEAARLKDTDYQLILGENINAGNDKGTFIIRKSSIGNYSFSDFEGSFDIVPMDVKYLEVQLEEEFIYDKKEKMPCPVVKDEEQLLFLNRDYTLCYKDNVNAGIGKIIIKGMGNYSGQHIREFVIEKRTPNLVVSVKNKIYDQKPLIAARDMPADIEYSFDGDGKEEISWYDQNGQMISPPAASGSFKVGIAILETENYKGLAQQCFDVKIERKDIENIEIKGIKAPVKFSVPENEIEQTEQYKAAAVVWTPPDSVFKPNTAYSAEFTLYPRDNFKLTSSSIISVDDSLSLTSSLLSDGGMSVRVYFDLTEKKVPQKLEIDFFDEIDVPTAEPMKETEAAYPLSGRLVYDDKTEDRDLPFSWSLNKKYPNVRIDNNTLFVSSRASGGKIGLEMSLEGTDLSAFCISAIKREASVETKIEITPKAAVILMPKGSRPSTLSFKAQVYDQYGQDMGKRVKAWSLKPQKIGVKHNRRGKIDVFNSAEQGKYTITASYGSANSQEDFYIKDKEKIKIALKDISVRYLEDFSFEADVENNRAGDISFSYFDSEGKPLASKPKAVGRYTVLAEFEDDCCYGSASASLVIEPAELGEHMFEDIADTFYTGSLISPKIKVKDGFKLRQDEDFICCYENNLNCGEASVILKGIGSFEGTIKKSFGIKPANITASLISDLSKVYDGNTDAPDIVFKIPDLSKEGSHILIKYTDNKFSDSSVGEKKKIILGTRVSADISNYCISYPDFTGEILRREVFVTALPSQKNYGQKDPKIQFTAEGVIEGESLLGSLVRDEGENVGKYKINLGTMTEFKNPNYAVRLSQDCGNFEIKPSPVLFDVDVSPENQRAGREVFITVTAKNANEPKSLMEKGMFSNPIGISLHLKNENIELYDPWGEGVYRGSYKIPYESDTGVLSFVASINDKSGNYLAQSSQSADVKVTKKGLLDIIMQTKRQVEYAEDISCDFFLMKRDETDTQDISGSIKIFADQKLIGKFSSKQGKFTLKGGVLKSGRHTLSAEYEGDDYFDSTRSEIDILVVPKILELDVSDMKAVSKREGTEGETKVCGSIGLKGILKGDEVYLKNKSFLTYGFKSAINAGVYDVFISPQDGLWLLEGKDSENYTLSEYIPKLKASVNKVVAGEKEKIPSLDKDADFRFIYEYGISSVPPAFENNEQLDAPYKIEECALKKVLSYKSGFKHSQVYDVSLQISHDEGKSWQDVPSEKLEGKKLKIKIPYPPKSGIYSKFNGTHMLTDRYSAGKFERLNVKNRTFGIQMTVTGLSPVALSWRNPPKEEPLKIDAERSFWLLVKMYIEDSLYGDIIEINAGSFDRMPWDVMEALSAKPYTTLIIHTGENQIIIPGENALAVEKWRIYYPFSLLKAVYGGLWEEWHEQPKNPKTGSEAIHIEASYIYQNSKAADMRNTDEKNRLKCLKFAMLLLLPILFSRLLLRKKSSGRL